MSENQTLDDLVKEIERSPLFYLFSASKEEFHSNFWLWLFKLNPDAMLKLFIDDKELKEIVPEGTTHELIREHNIKLTEPVDGKKSIKLDLVLLVNGEIKLVIENKIKDYATKRQLDLIRNNIKGKPKFVLATLFDFNDETELVENWKVVTYGQISKNIGKSIFNFSKEDYHQNLISDYKNFTNILDKISKSKDLKELENGNQYNFFSKDNETLRKLDEIKICEGYKKYRASHLVNEFFKTVRDKFEFEIEKPGFGIGSRKRITIDFYKREFKFSNMGNLKFIGIQLEENEYRIFIEGNIEIKNDKNLQKYVFELFNGRLKTKYNGGKDHRTYELKNNQLFIHRYENINELDYNELFKKVIKDIEIINEIKLR